MESSTKTRLPLHSKRYHLPFVVTPQHSQIGIIFTHISFTNGGENKEGSQKSPFLAINAKGGEILSPKQKDRTTNFKKFRTTNFKNYRNDDLCLPFQLVSYDRNFFN
jgi:hypothetical protein